MAFSDDDKRILAWMDRMQNLRVLYVDDLVTDECCPTCHRPLRQRTKRARPGVVTRVYGALMRADLLLDDGTKVGSVAPSFVDTQHGIDGVHPYHFFPASGAWPDAPDETSAPV